MSLDKVLADLKEKYIADLPDTIALISALHEGNEFEQIREEFHKLKGTGETYGLKEVSQLGEAMENVCVYSAEEVDKMTPVAIRLLGEIHNRRSLHNEALNLDQNADFATIQNSIDRGKK